MNVLPIKNKENAIKKVFSEWDNQFSKNLNQPDVFELLLAANYLNIPSLLDLMTTNIADKIKGKTVEEIRVQFNIKNDFTPEEEEKVRQETQWCDFDGAEQQYNNVQEQQDLEFEPEYDENNEEASNNGDDNDEDDDEDDDED